jgi:uncharacterized alkaline shock family protein YloU
MKLYNNPNKALWPQLTERVTSDDAVIEARVLTILEHVRKDGDKALAEIAAEIDKVDLSEGIEVTAEEIEIAAAEVSDGLKASIANAYENIYAFHNAQTFGTIEVQTAPGVKCFQKAMPIQKVGRNAQENVRKSIESMTGLHVDKVDLHVVGVSFEKENQELQQSQKIADMRIDTDDAEKEENVVVELVEEETVVPALEDEAAEDEE